MKLIPKTLAAATLLASCSSVAGVAVIVNGGNTGEIDAKTIESIYLGKSKSLPGAGSATVLSLPDASPATEAFLQSALNKSNSQFKAYWAKLAFTGKGTPPKEVDNDSDMINAVKSNPDAIGFVDAASVTDGVRVVGNF